MIKVCCPKCGKQFNLEDKHAGRKAKCICGNIFLACLLPPMSEKKDEATEEPIVLPEPTERPLKATNSKGFVELLESILPERVERPSKTNLVITKKDLAPTPGYQWRSFGIILAIIGGIIGIFNLSNDEFTLGILLIASAFSTYVFFYTIGFIVNQLAKIAWHLEHLDEGGENVRKQ